MLAQCQASLDDDLDAGIDCWKTHADHWPDLKVETQSVHVCLNFERDHAKRLRECVAKPEKSDQEILQKKACLAGYPAVHGTADALLCAPLTLDAIETKIAHDVDYDAVKARVDRLAVAAKARVDRCKGPLAFGLAVKLRLDASITPASVSGCVYRANGVVATTTRDGWAIVTLSADVALAVKTSTRYVDHAYVQIDGLTFLGVRAFDRVDGGTASIPAFKSTR